MYLRDKSGYSPEGDGGESPLCNGSGLVYFSSVQIERHELDPKGRTVGVGQEQAFKVFHVLRGPSGVQQSLLSL